jgi:hypothetical protein
VLSCALAVTRKRAHIPGMDTAPRADDRADALSPETEADRQRRLA